MSRTRSLANDYVELRCHSAFSFLEGASNPEDLINQAATLGHSALALADRNGLYGAPRFFQAAKRTGLHPLIGAELEIRDNDTPKIRKGTLARPHKLYLLVESQLGYRNLSRLLTLAQRRSSKGEAFAVWSELETYGRDLIALTRGDGSLTYSFVDRSKMIFPGRFWIDISRNYQRYGENENRYAIDLANAVRIPIVATRDVRYAHSKGRRILDIFRCLRAKTILDKAGKTLTVNREQSISEREDTAVLFSDQPDWILASREISERCDFTLDKLNYHLPTFCCPHDENPESWLYSLTFKTAKDRYGQRLPQRVIKQLKYELSIIERRGLSGYFLIVYDIARYAREHNILCQGRGSAANSVVCYSLGITAIDPIKMDLLFERFLSDERSKYPDIDLDLPSGKQRERVIQYVFNKYGNRNVAMTSTVITYGNRSAVRDIAKVLGISPQSIDALANIFSSMNHESNYEDLHYELRRSKFDPLSNRLALLFELVNQIRGLPRYLGQHPGGIVIAAGSLDEIVPIEPTSMPHRSVIQWDKDDCADLGIIKIDLLGLGMLNALEEIVPLVHNTEGIKIDLARLPQKDAKTYKMIQDADTIGLFQLESRAQMTTLPRMKPQNFYDLVVEIALIRPGPIRGNIVNSYLNRRSGHESISYIHPDLEPILKRTLGIPIFQEQLLRIAMVAAGISAGEAEELRRSLGFKRSDICVKHIEKKLSSGMRNQGLNMKVQKEVIRNIASLASYGFPESHSASFALIAYASAYLRAHYPAAFLVGMLNAYPLGFYSAATLIKDAQRHGVEVLPIDVTCSKWCCTLEHNKQSFAARLGLQYVNSLRSIIGTKLETERLHRPYTSLTNLCSRVALTRNELDTLAELGALHSVDPITQLRRSALWQVASLERDPDSLFFEKQKLSNDSPLEEMTPLENTLADYRNSGATVGPHIMSYLREDLGERNVLTAGDLKHISHGNYVRTAGHVIACQRPNTANGTCFLTLEDETGFSNGIIRSKQFQKFRTSLRASQIIEIAGTIQNINSVVQICVSELIPINIHEEMPNSHDYH